MCANVYLSIARSTFRSAALGPVRKFLIIVSALLNKERAPSTALEHSLRTKSSVTKSGQFYNKIKNLNFIIPTVCEFKYKFPSDKYSYTRLLFTSKKLCITARAPARPSKLTFQVKASPLAFSESNSFMFLGNALRQSNIIRGNNPTNLAIRFMQSNIIVLLSNFYEILILQIDL